MRKHRSGDQHSAGHRHRGQSQPDRGIGAVGAARENARSVRDALTGDVFESLNGAYLTLTRGLMAAASPGPSMHRVIERLMVVNGAVEWTMSRDEGHWFLMLGRSLELEQAQQVGEQRQRRRDRHV